MRACVRELAEERLIGWFAAAQCMEADMLTGKVDFTTDQAMQPILGDAKVVAEQIDIAVFGAAANEDHGADH